MERAPFALDSDGADAVVLAGDIARGTRGVNWARESARDRPVLYVAGRRTGGCARWPGRLRAM
jgi:hypothetical protein